MARPSKSDSRLYLLFQEPQFCIIGCIFRFNVAYLLEATVHHSYFLSGEFGLSKQFLEGDRSGGLLPGSCAFEIKQSLFRSWRIRRRSHLWSAQRFLSDEILLFFNISDALLLIRSRSHHDYFILLHSLFCIALLPIFPVLIVKRRIEERMLDQSLKKDGFKLIQILIIF